MHIGHTFNVWLKLTNQIIVNANIEQIQIVNDCSSFDREAQIRCPVDNPAGAGKATCMENTSNLPLPLVEDPDVGITLSDGCRLSARIWRPQNADAEPVPAILEYLPYRKRDGTTARDALTHPWFAERGYACVRVDMRGSRHARQR